ncbi:MFS transporter [Erythrobacter sp. YT30]|uniref:MFS transporter n=1 Tax=Erythrobacter sp. YT30 TaxID=1735012 RepID=UPI00076DC4DC|nr:MFS transporter [Erythrobacter sp. YT30]KWV92689.1 MFS transporter [Erythrobacter sp. YT30]
MTTSTNLLRKKRFLPLMVTQFFNAFNDNLFKTALVLFVVYSVYNDEKQEALFSGLASVIFIVPFVILSALAGQLADTRDKAAIIRTVKICEIGWASLGAFGLFLAWQGIAVHTFAIPLLLFVVFLAAAQSTFLGPIKYAILPQHLEKDEVLPGTGLIEAGTYIAILTGTILAGFISVEVAMVLVVITSFIGYLVSRFVPDAPPQSDYEMHYPLLEPYSEQVKSPLLRWLGYAPVAVADQAVMSWRLIRDTMHNREIWLSIVAISFFWTIGAVLFIQFPPLAKNQLLASKEVASLFLVIFSVGIAIGSVGINALLKGEVSARFSPFSVVVMGAFVLGFYLVAKAWTPNAAGELLPVEIWILEPLAIPLSLMLLGISTAGGFFVVPLYAFLTTRCEHDAASRTIAANNIVNSLSMVIGSIFAIGLTTLGIPVVEQLLFAAAMTVVSAWLGYLLYKAEKDAKALTPQAAE